MCSVMQNERKLIDILLGKEKTTICNLGKIVNDEIQHPCGRIGLQECSVQKYQQCYVYYKEKCGTYE